MIAVVEEMFWGGTAVDTAAQGAAAVVAVSIPAVAAPAFNALVAVSHMIMRIERIALTAIVRRKSAARVLSLLERRAALVEAQNVLARSIAGILDGLGA
jgi:hypothetical protein